MVETSITFTTQQIVLKIYFLDSYKDKNAKLNNFFAVPTTVEKVMEALPLLIILLFSRPFPWLNA